MALEKFYFFKLRNGIEYEIKVTIIHINTTINRNYRELTDEQREFYIANPTATVQEVVYCSLTPPYEPPVPELQYYIAVKKKELKAACLSKVTVTTVERCRSPLSKNGSRTPHGRKVGNKTKEIPNR